ncbi:hypothetical protein Dimus_008510 [Dionaea muscipula]
MANWIPTFSFFNNFCLVHFPHQSHHAPEQHDSMAFLIILDFKLASTYCTESSFNDISLQGPIYSIWVLYLSVSPVFETGKQFVLVGSSFVLCCCVLCVVCRCVS